MSTHLTPSDRTFMRHFAILIGLLAGIAVLLSIIGTLVWASLPAEDNHLEIQRADARIAPVGAVYAGSTGLAASAAVVAAAAPVAAAATGPVDGKTVFDSLCTACHTAGIAGAPKVGDHAVWAPRIAEGMNTLFKHAIDGYTGPDGFHMPAKGGNPALSDAEVEAAVQWMVAQSK